jgi:transcriptional regulator with XRE-family HTH domain
MEANLSQAALAKRIGVTFQQVLKYEKGLNRVGAARLTQIASALNVPISAFFDGISKASGTSGSGSLTELLTTPRAFKLLDAFAEIRDPGMQLAIIQLVRLISRAGGHK